MYIGSLRERAFPISARPVPGLPMVHWTKLRPSSREGNLLTGPRAARTTPSQFPESIIDNAFLATGGAPPDIVAHLHGGYRRLAAPNRCIFSTATVALGATPCRLRPSTQLSTPRAARFPRAANAGHRSRQFLFKLKGLLEQHFDEIARIITQECGKTLAESRGEMPAPSKIRRVAVRRRSDPGKLRRHRRRHRRYH